MKKVNVIVFGLLVAFMPLMAKAQSKAEVKTKGTTTQVTFYTPEIVRVVNYPSDATGPTR